MTGSLLLPRDFDGFSLTGTAVDGGVEGIFLADFDIASQFPLAAVMATAAGNFPTFVRGDPEDKVIPVHLTVRGTLSQARLDEIKKAFSPSKPISYLRVVDELGNTRRMKAKSLGVVPWEEHDDQSYVASLHAPMPLWENDSVETSTSTLSGTTAAGSTFTMQNIGNERTYPAFTLTPAAGAAAGVFPIHIPITIAWRSPLEGVDSLGQPYPIDITDALLDTASMAGNTTGTDIRVFVDGIETDRYLERMESATTSVWCSIAFQPARTAVLAAAMTALSPAAGESLTVDDTSPFPERGVLLIGAEAISYKGKTATQFLDVRRGRNVTIPAIHAVGATVYWVEHDIRIVMGYTGAYTPLADADRKPIIDLANSTNGHHKYGTTDGFIDPDSLRTGQWLRELRGTTRRATYSAMAQASGAITITDALPDADAPNFDSLSLYAPCFITATGTSFQLDAQIDHHMLGEIYGVDDGGFETLLHQRTACGWLRGLGYVAPSASQDTIAYVTKGFVADDDLARLTLRGRTMAVAGLDPGSGLDGLRSIAITAPNATPANETRAAQVFQLPYAQIDEATFWVEKGVGTANPLLVELSIPSTTDPEDAVYDSATVAAADLNSPGQRVSVRFSDANSAELDSYGAKVVGRGAVVLQDGGGVGTAQINGDENYNRIKGGQAWFKTGTPAVWAESDSSDLSVMLSSADNPETEPAEDVDLGTGRYVKYRNVLVNFDPASTPTIVMGTVTTSGYMVEATIENVTTGQVLTIVCPMVSAQSTLKIDCEAHAVTLKQRTDDHEVDALWAVEPGGFNAAGVYVTDIREWMRLDPGFNVITYVESALVRSQTRMTVTRRHRSRWT